MAFFSEKFFERFARLSLTSAVYYIYTIQGGGETIYAPTFEGGGP